VSELIISVSGMRGVVGETLTPEVAVRYATAFSALAPEGALVLSRDGRASGEMLIGAIEAALLAVGRDTFDADVAATPTTGILIREIEAAGGIQISASHNPIEYNGLKLFSHEGRVIPAGPGKEVLDRYNTGRIDWVTQELLGSPYECTDSIADHLEAVLATVDPGRIRKRKLKVLLDANHGAGAVLGRRLLEQLGCNVTVLGEEPNGRFIHPPEPTPKNLEGVCSAVPKIEAEVGFCQDPDADRLAVIDRTGRYLGEEYTLAICVDHVLRQQKGPIVTNCSSSRMTQDLAEKYEVPFHRSAVGEAHVVDAMLACGAVFGGEGNGGPIDPQVGFVRDSFVGMARILDAMAARETTVAKLADELPRYEIVKTKIALDRQKIAAAIDALERHFTDATPDRLDGLRLDWPDRWLLVRPSNTEPIIRAVAEAKSEEDAKRLCEEAANVLADA